MKQWQGQALAPGAAKGEVFFYRRPDRTGQLAAQDPGEEWTRFQQATVSVREQRMMLAEKARREADPAAAEVFEIHAMLVEDDDFQEQVQQAILSGIGAAEAAAQAGKVFSVQFAEMEDEYFRQRAVDFVDVADALCAVLNHEEDQLAALDRPVILAAEELTPSETVRVPRRSILGFVTLQGSQSSHTAILARTLGVPALSGVPVESGWNGRQGVLDAGDGVFCLEPDEAMQDRIGQLIERTRREQCELNLLKNRETCTSDGRKIQIFANAASLEDVCLAAESGAEGIGLFRTEFLYLAGREAPTEEEQFLVYKSAVQAMGGRPVVLRTLDIGADKQVDYLDLPEEENPAMGLRAIRLCFARPEIFLDQLRAMLRAGAFGPVRIMFPMVATERELDRALVLLDQARDQLCTAGIAFGLDQVGIMVETPAAAVMSDVLARKVDFFSIGTNDLTQYTLAADRQNHAVGAEMDPHDPAVLRLIRCTVENAHANGIWAGICGELGADEELLSCFLDMGIDELSVSPPRVLPLRKAVVEM